MFGVIDGAMLALALRRAGTGLLRDEAVFASRKQSRNALMLFVSGFQQSLATQPGRLMRLDTRS